MGGGLLSTRKPHPGCGGSVALDWTVPLEELRSASLEAAPTLIILHGVTGGSAENYVKHMVCSQAGGGSLAGGLDLCILLHLELPGSSVRYGIYLCSFFPPSKFRTLL